MICLASRSIDVAFSHTFIKIFQFSVHSTDYVYDIPSVVRIQGCNHDFHLGGGLEVTIGGGLTIVEAEELRNLF